MIKIYVDLEDKQLEKLVKVFAEDFYYIKPSDMSSIEKSNESSILITDSNISFNGYIIGLVPLTTDECREKSRGKSYFLPQFEIEMYMFLMVLDDTLYEIKKDQGALPDNTFLAIPAKYSKILKDLETQVYQKIGSIRFAKIQVIDDDLNENFYIERKKSHEFLNRLKDTLVANIESDNLSIKERVLSAHDMANLIGISKSTIKSVDALVDDLIRKFLLVKDMKNYIDSLLSDNDDYGNILKLTMYCSIELSKSDNSISNDKIYNKLITAAMFMDVDLKTDKEKLVLNLDDSLTDFSRDERNSIRYHATEGARRLNDRLEFGKDELLLIERHHEKPDGSGFPRGLTSNAMSILQFVFITSYRFSHYVVIESRRKGVPSREIVKRVADTMSLEGFGQGQVLKYFSILVKKSTDDA
jgi:HD-GYP domain-containing protein (c-di-GMP phosphodiesterase class II)